MQVRLFRPGLVRVACVSTAFTALTIAVIAAMGVPRMASAHPVHRTSPSTDTSRLTLRDALRIAEQRNRWYLSVATDTAIARGVLRAARRLASNPEFSMRLPSRFVDGEGIDTEFELSQEFEWAGQRGLRIQAASRHRERAAYQVRNAWRLLTARVSDAFHRAYSEQQKMHVADRMLQLTQQLLDATRIQLREGEISTLEANLAEIEMGRARSRAFAARRSLSTAMLELKQQLDFDPGVSVQLIDDSTTVTAAALHEDVSTLWRLALKQRSDLRAARAAIQETQASLSLARRSRIPNVALGAVVERDRILRRSHAGITFGVTLPLFNRSQGEIAQRTAEFNKAILEAQETESRIIAEVADALQGYESTKAELTVYEEAVLQPVRQNNELLDAAYRAGKVALPTVLLLRNQLLDAELEYWDVWLAHRMARTQVHIALDSEN